MAAATIHLQRAGHDDVVDQKLGFLKTASDDDNDDNGQSKALEATLFNLLERRRCEESCVGWRSGCAFQTPNASWVSLRFSFPVGVRHCAMLSSTQRFEQANFDENCCIYMFWARSL